MKKKIIAILMSAALCAAFVSGCGSSAQSTAESQSESSAAEVKESSVEEAETEDTAAAADQLLAGKKVAYISNECASDWQSISTKYLKTLVEQAGGECKIYDPNNDANVQADMVSQAMVEEPDVLVIKPIDQAAIVPALQAVNDAGIPIITLDTGVIEDANVDIMCAIQTDQTSLGRTAAVYA